MAVEIITKEDLEKFGEALVEKFNEIASRMASQTHLTIPKPEEQEEWIKSAQVKNLLGVSPSTLQNMRVNGVLPYTKIGGVILYSRKEITKMIEENKRNVKIA